MLNTVFGAGDDQFSWRADWMATITGRAGITYSNNLFYVKGGYAGVNNRLSVSDVVPVVGSGSQTRWHDGWTPGTGGGTYTFDARPRDIQSAVVRLSYKFGGVPAARY